jgi:hypothetical protein
MQRSEAGWEARRGAELLTLACLVVVPPQRGAFSCAYHIRPAVSNWRRLRQRGRGHSSHGPDGARTGGLRCLSAESCARLLLHALHWGSHQCPFPSLSCLFACTLAVTGRSGDCTWAVPSPGPDTMPSATSRPHPELLPCFLRCTCRLCTCRGQATQSGLSAHHLGCAGWRFQSAADGRFRPDTARARQPCHSETNARHWLPSCHSLVLHQNCLSDLPT